MAGNHPKTEAWDRAVQAAIVATDHEMERLYGAGVQLRRNRPQSGSTANPQMDGLFNINLVFTNGANSLLGRGYSLDIEVGSNEDPSPEMTERYTESCRKILEAELQKSLPGRNLHFERDGDRWKLQGDFSLGMA